MPTAEETHQAWAVRSWDAEVENARRLATRVNVVLTVALAAAAATKVLGDTLSPERLPGDAFLLRTALLGASAAGVVCIFVAFARVLIKRQSSERPPSASAHLLPPEDVAEFDHATVGLEKRAMLRAFLSTAAAAYELHARNAEERKRLADAQQWLIVGAALTLLCGAVYTWNRPSTAIGGVVVRLGEEWRTNTPTRTSRPKSGRSRTFVGRSGKSGFASTKPPSPAGHCAS